MSKENISIGIIGAGAIARNIHLPCLARIENIKVQAICDIEIDKAKNLANQYGIPGVYALYREMLAEQNLDAVFVLTQPDQIFRICLDCLEAGLDVFTEKPAGITAFQTHALFRKAKERSAIMQVGLNRRYIPLLSHVADIMREQTRINQINAYFVKHGDASFYGGCASSFVCDTIHAIDTMLWLAGSRPVKAATMQGQYNSAVPNAWNALIAFENGITGVLQANYNTGGRAHGIEIFGDTISAYINLGFGSAACNAELIYNKNASFSLASGGNSGTELERIDGIALAESNEYYVYYGYLKQNTEFIRSIRERTTPLCSIEESVKTMELVEMLLDSRI
ncbi:MAG: Gfo/Idh/MocA family protein [Christensenellales bacterium]|jgi:virulence factor